MSKAYGSVGSVTMQNMNRAAYVVSIDRAKVKPIAAAVTRKL
jgi:hypothetical protein